MVRSRSPPLVADRRFENTLLNEYPGRREWSSLSEPIALLLRARRRHATAQGLVYERLLPETIQNIIELSDSYSYAIELCMIDSSIFTVFFRATGTDLLGDGMSERIVKAEKRFWRLLSPLLDGLRAVARMIRESGRQAIDGLSSRHIEHAEAFLRECNNHLAMALINPVDVDVISSNKEVIGFDYVDTTHFREAMQKLANFEFWLSGVLGIDASRSLVDPITRIWKQTQEACQFHTEGIYRHSSRYANRRQGEGPPDRMSVVLSRNDAFSLSWTNVHEYLKNAVNPFIANTKFAVETAAVVSFTEV